MLFLGISVQAKRSFACDVMRILKFKLHYLSLVSVLFCAKYLITPSVFFVLSSTHFSMFYILCVRGGGGGGGGDGTVCV